MVGGDFVKAKIERRVYDRFEPKVPVFATLMPEFKKMGRVRDISWGGLAFEYLDVAGNWESAKESALTLYVPLVDFSITPISCQRIWDVELVKEDESQISLPKYRLCGVKFKNLSLDIGARLEYLFNNFVTGKESWPLCLVA